jgi:hypothetical protein
MNWVALLFAPQNAAAKPWSLRRTPNDGGFRDIWNQPHRSGGTGWTQPWKHDVDVEALIRAFAQVARPEILRHHSPDSCVASTWVTVQVMSHFGLGAEPLELRVSVFNSGYLRRERKLGRPLNEREICAPGVWSVGIGHPPFEAGGLGGHLTARVARRYLVDASIDQASDPAHGIQLPGVLWGGIDEDRFIRSQAPLRLEVGDQAVEYWRRPTTVDFRSLPDWGRTPEIVGALDRIVTMLDGEFGS